MTTDLTFAPARGAAHRLVQVAAPRDGSTTVTGCPEGAGARALHKLSRVVFWPVPTTIDFDALMALRDGQVVCGLPA